MKSKIAMIVCIPLIVVLTLCIINFYGAKGDNLTLPITLSSNIDEYGFTTYEGFGVNMTVYQDEGTEPQEIISTVSYNEIAGTIDTWSQGIWYNEYEQYKEHLVAVNGDVVNSEIFDDHIEYTFANKLKLNVNIGDTADIREYVVDIKESDQPKTKEEISDNVFKYTYESGMVKIDTITYTEGSEPLKFKSNYYINFKSLFGYYAIGFAIAFSVYVVIDAIKDKGKYREKE